jgi:hypothetical protein
MNSPHTQQMLRSNTAFQHGRQTMRDELPRILGMECWGCQQMVQINVGSPEVSFVEAGIVAVIESI